MSATTALDELVSIRNRFDPEARARKRDLLSTLEAMPLTSTRVLQRYHDVLLFLAAHPDDAEVLRVVERSLVRVAEAASTHRRRAALENTGIGGSVIRNAYTYDTVAWLADRFPADAEIDWDDEEAGTGLDPWLQQCVPTVERDGFYDYGGRDWLRTARAEAGTDLGWFVRRFGELPLAGAIRDMAFETITLPVAWTLRDAAASTTLARFPERRPFWFRDGLQRGVDLPAVLRRAVPEPDRLSSAAARRLIDTARVTLTCRGRETDPVTYANPNEVILVRLSRGLDIALFGLLPDRRLPLESFFGYIAVRNRVPLAYGGAWVFADRAEVGINVFDSFRGGESALVFAEILSVYRQLFNVRRLQVDPFQIGDDNEDGIRSGAYWFYYRFGFRPADLALTDLAAEHYERMRGPDRVRTPAAVLRRLARGGLQMKLPAGRDAPAVAPRVQDVGQAVTRAIVTRFDGDREAAMRWARRRVARLLPKPDRARRTEASRRGFDEMSLLVALFDDLEEWPHAARRDLSRLMQARGGPRERDYALRVNRHARFIEALCALVRWD